VTGHIQEAQEKGSVVTCRIVDPVCDLQREREKKEREWSQALSDAEFVSYPCTESKYTGCHPQIFELDVYHFTCLRME